LAQLFFFYYIPCIQIQQHNKQINSKGSGRIGASIKTYAEKNGLSYQQAVRKKNRILEKLRKYVIIK
jgi:hypothetical protein